MYQSIHTTITVRNNHAVECVIRTTTMHASERVAAHREITMGHGADQLRELMDELFWIPEPPTKRVVVLTPDGDLVDLPAASTVIDFAYAIHTEIGHAAHAARVNGEEVPLIHRLEHADLVEVLVGKEAAPRREWLIVARTKKARRHIRRWHNRHPST